VICTRCGRWNLTPLEERWEAIDESERLFRGTRLRMSTDNIGLAQFRGGFELVRVGPALLPEIASWRYGTRLARFEPEATPPGGARWGRFALASAGMLINAALITRIGFTLSCALLFAIVAFACGSRQMVRNVVVGLLVSYPVFLMFNKVLGLNLPVLLANGWI